MKRARCITTAAIILITIGFYSCKKEDTNRYIEVTGISISPEESLSIAVGSTVTFAQTVTPANATNGNVIWSSAHTNIATVNARTGVVTGVAAGTTSIRATATDGSRVFADKSVTVVVVMVTGIAITPDAPLSVEVGETATLSTTMTPTNATSLSVTWSSLAPDRATVHEKTGVVTGIAPGLVTICATATDGSGLSANKEILVTYTPDGTPEKPFMIFTANDLNSIRNNLNAYYKLGNDIDLTSYLAGSAQGWEPIGTMVATFSGGLDGAGFKITALWIDRTEMYDIGLFGYMENAVIKNLGVEIESAGIKGWFCVGGIAGNMINSHITRCYASGGTVSGIEIIGGIAGEVTGYESSINCCYSTCNVICDYDNEGWDYTDAGGIAGTGTHIRECYASGAVSGDEYVGGITGYTPYTITNCVALNRSVKAIVGPVGRVVAFNANRINNWARKNMDTNGGLDFPDGSGPGHLNGADCDDTPTPQWWTTPAPNGPGWSADTWIFEAGQLPKLR